MKNLELKTCKTVNDLIELLENVKELFGGQTEIYLDNDFDDCPLEYAEIKLCEGANETDNDYYLYIV